MAIKLTSMSRFKFSEPIIFDGVETFGVWTRPDWMKPGQIESSDIIQFTVDQSTEGRPDLIAQQVYGTPNLEWIVIMFNSPLEPIGFPKAGTVIKLPSNSVVGTNI